MRIKKGDTVKIMKGKDVGKQGKVLKVLPEEDKIVVEGSNMFKKHIKGDGRERESSIVDIAKPIYIANVMLVCQACGKPTRIGIVEKGGKKVRICKKCGKSVDATKPSSSKTSTSAKRGKPSKGKQTKKKTATKKVTTKKTTKTKPSSSKTSTSRRKTVKSKK